MSASHADYKDRQFLAVIGDEVDEWNLLSLIRHAARFADKNGKDSVTGLLLAGIGVGVLCFALFPRSQELTAAYTVRQHVTPAPDSQKNFLVVDGKTENSAIEAAFDRFTTERKDIGIVLINQHVSLVSMIAREAVYKC